ARWRDGCPSRRRCGSENDAYYQRQSGQRSRRRTGGFQFCTYADGEKQIKRRSSICGFVENAKSTDPLLGDANNRVFTGVMHFDTSETNGCLTIFQKLQIPLNPGPFSTFNRRVFKNPFKTLFVQFLPFRFGKV